MTGGVVERWCISRVFNAPCAVSLGPDFTGNQRLVWNLFRVLSVLIGGGALLWMAIDGIVGRVEQKRSPPCGATAGISPGFQTVLRR